MLFYRWLGCNLKAEYQLSKLICESSNLSNPNHVVKNSELDEMIYYLIVVGLINIRIVTLSSQGGVMEARRAHDP